MASKYTKSSLLNAIAGAKAYCRFWQPELAGNVPFARTSALHRNINSATQRPSPASAASPPVRAARVSDYASVTRRGPAATKRACYADKEDFMRKVIPLAGLAVLLAYTTTPARAWEPTHPIEIIVPAGTGG